MRKPLISFEAWETVEIVLPGLDLGNCPSFAHARAWASSGTHRWILGAGLVLRLVKADYTLRDREFWVRPDPNGNYHTVLGSFEKDSGP